MKFVDEYRNTKVVEQLANALSNQLTKNWVIMEICGGQTNAFLRFGLDQFLQGKIELIHGPGCPVCVTAVDTIDKILYLAMQPDIILCTFGDMMRVPGSRYDLWTVKASGADIRVIYAPMDALAIARQNPDKKIILFAIGFETTAPATALSIIVAKKEKIKNFFILSAHVKVPAALKHILNSPGHRLQGILAAGHVCTVMGYQEYKPIASKYGIPITVTGFEPFDLLYGIYRCVYQLENGMCEVENNYSRVVKEEGNHAARQLIEEVYVTIPQRWRGIGEIPDSGLDLSKEYSDFDAKKHFKLESIQTSNQLPQLATDSICIAGAILQGIQKPFQCPAFAKECTPDHPLGAPMVSSEGACAAYYRYRKSQNFELTGKG